MYKLPIEKSDLHNGLVQYTAYQGNWPAPIGMAWVLGFSGPKKDGAMLFDCYVSVGSRREGIMSQIVEAILKDFEYVTSEGVSKEGVAFMKANGFKYRKESGDYIKTRSNR